MKITPISVAVTVVVVVLFCMYAVSMCAEARRCSERGGTFMEARCVKLVNTD